MSDIILAGDLHTHPFAAFSYTTPEGQNSRLAATMDVGRQIFEKSKELNDCPVLFLGDWFHSRRQVPVDALHASLELLSDYPKSRKYFVLGNHDKLFNKANSPYSIKVFEKYGEVIVRPRSLRMPGVGLFYVLPWLDSRAEAQAALSDFARASAGKLANEGNVFLCGHAGITGAVVGPDDFAMTGELDVKSLHAGNYKWCFFSHFHKHQLVNGTDNVYYIGSPIPTDMGERTEKKGFVVINAPTSHTSQWEFVNTYHPNMYKVQVKSRKALQWWMDENKPARGSVLVIESQGMKLEEIRALEAKFYVKLVRPRKEEVVDTKSIAATSSRKAMVRKYLGLIKTPKGLKRERLERVGNFFLDEVEL